MHACFWAVSRLLLESLELEAKKKSCKGKKCFSYHGAKMWTDLLSKLSRRRPCFASKNIVVSFLLIFDASVIRL